MRCRVLALAFSAQGYRCALFGPSKEILSEQDHSIFCIHIEESSEAFSEEEAHVIAQLSQHGHPSIVVLDDYRVTEAYQLRLRVLGVKWLQFESNLGSPVWADWVLYANPALVSKDQYTNIKNEACKFLLGPAYAPLRDEFSSIQSPRRTGSVKKILLAFGGGNDRGATLKVTRAIEDLVLPYGLEITIVCSGNNPNKDKLVDLYADYLGGIHLLISPLNMAQVIADHDLAIVSGGTLTYEVAACNVPFLILAVSENQHAAIAWREYGIAEFLGSIEELDQNSIREIVKCYLEDEGLIHKLRKALSKNKICDGEGAKRVVAALVRDDL